MYEETQHDTEG